MLGFDRVPPRVARRSVHRGFEFAVARVLVFSRVDVTLAGHSVSGRPQVLVDQRFEPVDLVCPELVDWGYRGCDAGGPY